MKVQPLHRSVIYVYLSFEFHSRFFLLSLLSFKDSHNLPASCRIPSSIPRLFLASASDRWLRLRDCCWFCCFGCVAQMASGRHCRGWPSAEGLGSGARAKLSSKLACSPRRLGLKFLTKAERNLSALDLQINMQVLKFKN